MVTVQVYSKRSAGQKARGFTKRGEISLYTFKNWNSQRSKSSQWFKFNLLAEIKHLQVKY